MKKNSNFKLQSIVDIKIFLLFLLDNIRYPIDYTTLSKIISENVDEVTFGYEECLRDLTDSEHEMLLSLALFIFVAARMILTVSLPMAEKNARIAILEDAAGERAHIAADTERRYDEAYA